MAENTPYFEDIVAQRAMLLTEDEALQGNTTLSVETVSAAREDAATVIRENLPAYLPSIRKLSETDQDILLAYFLSSKTQTHLSSLFNISQTNCSAWIREALVRLGSAMLLHDMSERTLKKILEAGQANVLVGEIPMSTLIAQLVKVPSVFLVAATHHIKAPKLRYLMRQVAIKLEQSKSHEAVGLAAYLNGRLARKNKKLKNQKVDDPAVVGKFYVSVTAPGFNEVFNPLASDLSA